MSLYLSGSSAPMIFSGDGSTVTVPKDSLRAYGYIFAVDDAIFEGNEIINLVVDTTDYGNATSTKSISFVIKKFSNWKLVFVSILKRWSLDNFLFSIEKIL